jgi:hypothetical protein
MNATLALGRSGKRRDVKPVWQMIWRVGLAPQLDLANLEALRLGLVRDDPNLLQNRTCNPQQISIFLDDRIEGCCALSFGAWQTGRLTRVGDLAAHFERVCSAADEAIGEPGACGRFLNWYDQTPRPVMRRALLQEVTRLLNERRPGAAA